MIGNDDRKRALDEARRLEQGKDLRAAVQAYQRAGAPLQAARVLAIAGDPSGAGDLLLEALEVDPADIPVADKGRRKIAMAASFYFIRGKAHDRAVDVLLALGERERAAAALEQAGDLAGAARLRTDVGSFDVDLGEDVPPVTLERKVPPPSEPTPMSSPGMFKTETSRPGFATTAIPAPDLGSRATNDVERARRFEKEGHLEKALKAYVDCEAIYDAARVAYRLKLPSEAGELLLEIDRHYEAAKCFAEARKPDKAMAALLKVKKGHPRYQRAMEQIAQLAPRVSELPKDRDDLYRLATLLDRYEATDAAIRAYETLLAQDPTYRDAAERLRRLGGGATKRTKRKRRRAPTTTRHRSVQLPEERTAHGPPVPKTPFEAPAVSFDPGPAFRAGAPAASAAPAAAAAPSASEGTSPTPRSAPSSPPVHATTQPVTSPEELLAPGVVIDERYRVIGKIGEGATASVLEVEDLELGEKIAMKLFHLNFSDNDVYAQRMKREIRLCRRLTHPNIIRLYDIGRYMAHRYLTMELLTGKTLKHLLIEDLVIGDLCEYFAQAALGLHEAHHHGIIHRDIKPDNLFLTEERVVKVMDFGIAKQSSADGMTLSGTILGTPGYMAPEQIDGSTEVSAAADQYALGSVAYRLLTRTKVFEHPEIVPLLMMHATREPEPPSARNAQISEELEAVVLKLLAKEPENRYPDCAAVAAAFKKAGNAYS